MKRLDSWVSEIYGCSRAVAKAWILSGKVRVHGAFSKPAFVVTDPDAVSVAAALEPDIPTIRAKAHDLDFLFEDDALVVINKPIDCVVHGGPNVLEQTLVDSLKARGIVLPDYPDVLRCGIVHRLDKHTEGVMVIAKTEACCRHLQRQFQDRLVEKRYYAWVKGNVLSDSGILDRPIGRHPKHPLLYWVSPDGKPSETQYEVLKRLNTKTLLDLRPITGRTHQIRVHLAAFDHPVLQDPEYGTGPGSAQLLQAYHLGFRHPDGRYFRFVLPLSKRLRG